MNKGQNKTQEMSVEEILESIRRVIGDDAPSAPVNHVPEAIKHPPMTSSIQPQHTHQVQEENDDILELTTPIKLTHKPQIQTQDKPEAFLARDTINKTTQQIDELMSAVGNSFEKSNNNSHQSIDALVSELIKPQLKQWLDANLPGLVTTIVRQEISKITSQIKTK